MADSTLKTRNLIAAWCLLSVFAMGCTRSVPSFSKTAAMDSPRAADSTPAMSADEAPVSSDASESLMMRPMNSGMVEAETDSVGRAPSDQDPFGLLPLSWPEDIKIHPDARVAKTGPNGPSGSYVIALVPSDKATREGVQSFYLDLLSSWQSLRVNEIPDDNGSQMLVIVADRPGASIEISTGTGTAEIIRALGHSDYWSREVGENPILLRMFYSSL